MKLFEYIFENVDEGETLEIIAYGYRLFYTIDKEKWLLYIPSYLLNMEVLELEYDGKTFRRRIVLDD